MKSSLKPTRLKRIGGTKVLSVSMAIRKRADQKVIAYLNANAPTELRLEKATVVVKRVHRAKSAAFLDKYRDPVGA